ncbi:erythromycin esterase family protein [Poseidonocella sp. HB161398]|uniref:erythromycin esterase family protein n=1 Tax=Poseidonocella sp. HB161398 TaxID=2320855 RepID=UPI0011086FC6|nr:erythromycin esterase family protein [Poseidonocella sp. HB161398]
MTQEDARFADRADAGRRLGATLSGMGLVEPVVYALPRGGVPVALEVARALHAPLDLILVRKIGAPGAPEVALGAVVDGTSPQIVINEAVLKASRADTAYLEHARHREIAELERRRKRYLGDRAQVSPKGRTAIVVDDGLATGATMKAALISIRRQGAKRVCIAVPVAPADLLPEFRKIADHVVCLNPAPVFHGVGEFYDDFHQLTDEETVSLLQQGWLGTAPDRRMVSVPPLGLAGELAVPPDPRGLVIFAHGSGSSRLSPRNQAVAGELNARGFATLLFDLLTPQEARDRANVFNIPRLSERILEAVLYAGSEPDVSDLPTALFGASTGAGAALMAAAELGDRIAAVVSRGGRPDLAGSGLGQVTAPTLLIVGGEDHEVIALNRRALNALSCEKLMKVVPGATHLFEEPGTLETMAEMACEWFAQHLKKPPSPARAEAGPRLPADVAAALRRVAEPLPLPEDPNFAACFDRYGKARVVLLGEASHGTSEFYRARAAITRRLVERHGFAHVALEADWPDAASIDRFIRRLPAREDRIAPFSRFPAWMWRNSDMDGFVATLRRHNDGCAEGAQVRVYGLDLYSMTSSIAEVLGYLDRVDPAAAAEARDRYSCFAPWSREPAAYGRASLSRGYALCEAPVARTLLDLMKRELRYASRDGDDFFDATQNARLVASAERYYRVMYYGARESWNLRDRHMFETLQRILDRGGADAKAVVWAHNSHIGDARATGMGAERDELNIGQLCRETYGRQAVLIGFGTHAGTVAAASEWDAPMEVKQVRPSRPDSYEALCHAAGLPRFLLDLGPGLDPETRHALADPRLERYIGVIYRPETERWSHYSHATLPDQYDAFVWFDRTSAITPTSMRTVAGEEETYPFGI